MGDENGGWIPEQGPCPTQRFVGQWPQGTTAIVVIGAAMNS